MTLLRNLASAAPWSSRYFRLDDVQGVWSRCNNLAEGRIEGLGSTLVCISQSRVRSCLFGIYFRESKWWIFDGERSISLDALKVFTVEIVAEAVFGMHSLRIEGREYQRTVYYFSPWFRHWFEGGWAIGDIDIAKVIAILFASSEARMRLVKSLEIEVV